MKPKTDEFDKDAYGRSIAFAELLEARQSTKAKPSNDPPARDDDPVAKPDPVAATPDGFCSPTDIATAIKNTGKAEAIRKALGRLFEDNRLADGAWMENNNPAKGQAKILYKLSAARPLLARYEPPANG